jgi:Domain of unknown function (DUF4340)
MNFRITMFFFALLLTMLWVFGLMIARKKAGGDQTAIMPSLADRDIKIDKVIIKRAKDKDVEPFEAELVYEGGMWVLKDPVSKQTARVEGWRVDGFIKLIQNAKHDETGDVNKAPANYGLDKPRIEVTLEAPPKADGERRKWTFAVGEDRSGLAYVLASDHKDKVFAVPKKSLDPLFFKDPNHLRSKRLFDFGETGVTKIEGKRGADELEVKRDPATQQWTFIKPKYGPAGADSESEEKPKKKNPFDKEPPPPPATGGIKGLLNNISAIQVDDESDFEPLGSPMAKFDLEPGQETMRIEVSSANDKGDGVSKEILYIGKEVPNHRGFYYARMENDKGVVQIRWSRLEPIAKAIEDPGKLRSHDVAIFDPKLVDAAVIKQGKEELKKQGKDEIKFFKGEPAEPQFHFPKKPQTVENWEMIIGTDKKKAEGTMVRALLDQVLGKKAIVKFHDGKEDDNKKKEAEWGLDAASNPAEIAIYIGGIEKETKDTKKDDAKKDESKKDDTKKDPLPKLKKDHPAEVTLAIGKIDGDVVNIRRTLKDGSVTWFTINKDFVEKVLPPQIELAYLDTSLPALDPDDVVVFNLYRVTDKGPETLEMRRRFADGRAVWFVKDPLEPTGYKPAETSRVAGLITALSLLKAKKWVSEVDNSNDLDKYGLKSPTVKITLGVNASPNIAAAIVGMLCVPDSLVPAALGAAVHGEAGELMTIEFGKETDDPKDKPAAYAKESGSPLVFLVPDNAVKLFKDIDLRDRTSTLYSQVSMEAMCRANAAINPINMWMFASPYFTGTVQQLDPKEVTKVHLTVRTPYELRSFEFDRKEKEKPKAVEKAKEEKVKKEEKEDKRTDAEKKKAMEDDEAAKWTWIIDKKSGLQEFNVDPDKVAQFVKEFSKLHTDRFVAFAGGPRGEHKLDAKEATIKLEFTTKSGTVTLMVGANFQEQRSYFAHTSAWPEVVFLLPDNMIRPLLDGASHFAKPRSGAE